MLRAQRISFAALFSLALIGAPALAQGQIDHIDTTKLPRVNGAREVYAHPASTIVVTADPVAQTADAVRDALEAQGWKQYSSPNSSNAVNPQFRNMNFKKGRQSLSATVSVAPAQGGQTAVTYTALVHANDLPIPDDAMNLGFDPERPQLHLRTAATVPQLLEFYRRELPAAGYAEWIPGDARKIDIDPSETRATLYFTRTSKAPLVLILQRPPGQDRTSVMVQPVAADTLAAIESNPPSPHTGRAIPNNTPVASAGAGHQTPAPAAVAGPRKPLLISEMLDVRDLPRPDGAYFKDEQSRKNDKRSMNYMLPVGIAGAKAAVAKVLGENGWIAFSEPLEQNRERSLSFAKDRQQLSLHFSTDGENTTRSGVWLTTHPVQNDIPILPGSTDVVFEDRRPLLDTISPGTLESVRDFYRAELEKRGWSEWSAADQARYPNAKLEETIPDGIRMYFTRDARDRQPPIQVSIGRRKDEKVDIEVRVPPFTRPQELKADETFGMVRPELVKSSSARNGRTTKELKATVPAELDVVLAFYRRELTKRNWTETSAVANDDETTLTFTSREDGKVALKLAALYDLTTVEYTQQLTPEIIAAKEKAKRDAEEKKAREFEERMRASLPASEAAQTAVNSPLPVPAGATAVVFDGQSGELKFDTTSGVPEVAGFYRQKLKELGWQERPSVARPEIVALDLSKNGKRLYVSILQMGPRTHVRAYGPGLIAAAGGPAVTAPKAPVTQSKPAPAQTAAAPAKAEEPLEADEYNGYPVPESATSKQYSGSKFRGELNATVRASLDTVLAFYRREMGKRGWKEDSGATVGADRAALSYSSPEGPGSLTLSRNGGQTSIVMASRKPEAAKQAGILPKAGAVRVVMGNISEQQATITINNRSFALNAGVGKDGPNGPALELAPGTYRYTLKVPGKASSSESITVRADQVWALVVGPGGALALNIY